jgi:endonuclease/exonuclease/phosphatase family metal-dependent hydrolase
MEHLRVVSYNIHKGFTSGNRGFVLPEIRKALQEVQGEHRKRKEPQFQFLAQDLWPHFAYGKNAVYSSGHHGNAILSKFPFVRWENIDISTNRFEKRGLLHGWVKVPHSQKPLHLICVHLGLLEGERANQIEKLCQRIDSHVPHGEPLLIAGDFNDWRGKVSERLREVLEVREAFSEIQGSSARTFPSWLPALKLDRIYYRGLKARIAKCLNQKPWTQLSDHIALYAELTI